MIEENNEPIIISMYVYLLDINFIKRLPIDSSTLFDFIYIDAFSSRCKMLSRTYRYVYSKNTDKK